MRRVGSLIMQAAEACRVPAGGALAVDRYAFSDYITNYVRNHPLITVTEQEVTSLEQDGSITIVATGPLTSDLLSPSTIGAAASKKCRPSPPLISRACMQHCP